MHRRFSRPVRLVALALPLAALAPLAAYAAGCSSDDPAAPVTSPADDAGGADSAPFDATPTPTPVDATPADAAPALDCAKDLAADGLPKHLSCTGLYSDLASRAVAPANKAYTPGFEFWSDGAVKSRFLFLPAGAKIDTTDVEEWSFPVGTKVWKEFVVDGVLVETRLYEKLATGFQHATYRWSAGSPDALRKDNGEEVTRDGGAPYVIPKNVDCATCHEGKKDSLLGVEAVSLGLPTAKGVTLATLTAEDRFTVPLPSTAVAIPDGQSGTAVPALGWLHANCGSCHAKNGTSLTTLQLRLGYAQLVPGANATVASLDAYTTGLNKPSTRSDGAGGFVPMIKGGAPTGSLVSQRSGIRVPTTDDPSSGDQMPPLVSRRVDTVGHGALDAWITQLPP